MKIQGLHNQNYSAKQSFGTKVYFSIPNATEDVAKKAVTLIKDTFTQQNLTGFQDLEYNSIKKTGSFEMPKHADQAVDIVKSYVSKETGTKVKARLSKEY